MRRARDLLTTIPGIGTLVANVLVAETGTDVARFPSPGHLASWAGTCSGSHESTGRVKSTHTRTGDPYLRGALGIAAMSAAGSSKNTYFATKYRRIAARRGPVEAIVAVEHAMVTAISYMLTDDHGYIDPCGDCFTRRDPDQIRRCATNQLHAIDYGVTLTPHQDQQLPDAR